jgi:hypothetical protein
MGEVSRSHANWPNGMARNTERPVQSIIERVALPNRRRIAQCRRISWILALPREVDKLSGNK